MLRRFLCPEKPHTTKVTRMRRHIIQKTLRKERGEHISPRPLIVRQGKREVSTGSFSNHFECVAPRSAVYRRFRKSFGEHGAKSVLERDSKPGIDPYEVVHGRESGGTHFPRTSIVRQGEKGSARWLAFKSFLEHGVRKCWHPVVPKIIYRNKPPKMFWNVNLIWESFSPKTNHLLENGGTHFPRNPYCPPREKSSVCR